MPAGIVEGDNMKGLIFNIQRFSIHDGPGIRTVVFFKGCPLSCRWCSNPESRKNTVELVYDKKKCIGCLTCKSACGYDAILPTSDNKIKIDREKCTTCLACVDVCPRHALYTEGRFYTVEELMTEVMKDQVFYEGSGGGVTLSGGEPLAQGEFAIALLKALKSAGIHTVVETSGYVDEDVFKMAVKFIDLLYFDVKHYDDEKHREKTDVSNQLILQNLKYASTIKKDIVARIPMIPGYNDSLDDSEKYADLLAEYGIDTVHLLPFHQYGSGKYDLLGLNYEYRNVPNTREEALKDNLELFIHRGFKAQIGG